MGNRRAGRRSQTEADVNAPARPFLIAIWVGVGVQIAGRILDGIWHATNDEFEAASQQLEAHWLLWLGVIITVVAASLAVARVPAGERNWGYSLLLAGGLLYVPVSIWHFIEHANLNDPQVAHYLLALGQGTMIAGAIAALVLTRRAVHPA
jgi:hypothetical protein